VALKNIDTTSLGLISLQRKISSIRLIVSLKMSSFVFSVVIAPLIAFIGHHTPFFYPLFIII